MTLLIVKKSLFLGSKLSIDKKVKNPYISYIKSPVPALTGSVQGFFVIW